MRGKVAEGEYNFAVKVYDAVWTRDVISAVTVTIQEIGDDAVLRSGSIRLQGQYLLPKVFYVLSQPVVALDVMFHTGVTAEEFVERNQLPTGVWDLSMYDKLRKEIARKLTIPKENVDIFTVRNHPTLPKTIDVRYSAHGSPYYHPSRLDGIVNSYKSEVRLGIVETICRVHSMAHIFTCSLRTSSG